MFLHVSVSHSVHAGGSTWAGTPPWAGTPLGRYTPWAGTPPLSSACWEIQAPSRRYASYWNAFLFQVKTCAYKDNTTTEFWNWYGDLVSWISWDAVKFSPFRLLPSFHNWFRMFFVLLIFSFHGYSTFCLNLRLALFPIRVSGALISLTVNRLIDDTLEISILVQLLQSPFISVWIVSSSKLTSFFLPKGTSIPSFNTLKAFCKHLRSGFLPFWYITSGFM